MKTITVDILNDKALTILQDLESVDLIRLRKEKNDIKTSANRVSKYKGAMTKQSIDEIEKQLHELRNGWE